MTHELLVRMAAEWLRRSYRCGIVLTEQACASGEVPDVIGWRPKARSVVVECKASRADFLADRQKPWRLQPEIALGCERFYLAPAGIIKPEELPKGWGLLEAKARKVHLTVPTKRRSDLRSPAGLLNEMNLLLASLRRVEVRIEPQTITEFLQWQNRMLRYNGGTSPTGITPEANAYLDPAADD